jgi:hypothetical protein
MSVKMFSLDRIYAKLSTASMWRLSLNTSPLLTSKKRCRFSRGFNILLSFTLFLAPLRADHLTISLNQAEAQPKPSYEQRLDQVRLYIEKNLLNQAKTELIELGQSPMGKYDVRIASAMAIVAYKLHHMSLALQYLRKARKLSRDVQEKLEFNALHERWAKEYGLVRFESLDTTQFGRLKLKRTTRILNAKRKAVLKVVNEQISGGVTLPFSLYLPYGKYTANDTPFNLKLNALPSVVKVSLIPIPRQEQSTNVSSWVYIGVGGLLIASIGVGGYFLLK